MSDSDSDSKGKDPVRPTNHSPVPTPKLNLGGVTKPTGSGIAGFSGSGISSGTISRKSKRLSVRKIGASHLQAFADIGDSPNENLTSASNSPQSSRGSVRYASPGESLASTLEAQHADLLSSLAEFRKSMVSLLPSFLYQTPMSARGTFSTQIDAAAKVFPNLKLLDLKAKKITRLCCLIGVPSADYFPFMDDFRFFRSLVKQLHELQDREMSTSVEASACEVLSSSKLLLSLAKHFSPSLSGADRPAHQHSHALQQQHLGQRGHRGDQKVGSSVRLADIFEHAKVIAKSLGKMAQDHSTQPKVASKAALHRQTIILKFASLGRVYANLVRKDEEQKRLLLDFSSTIILAAGRLYSVEISLIERTIVGDPSSALQSALMAVTQMVSQFCQSCISVVQLTSQARAARKQKETSVWDEIPLKNPQSFSEATFNQLIQVITDFANIKNLNPLRVFFRTYPSLCSASYLFEKIKERYLFVPDSLGDVVKNQIQMGCLVCLKEWLASTPRDLSPELLMKIIKFDLAANQDGESSMLQPFLCTLALTHQIKLVVDRTPPTIVDEAQAFAYLDSLTAEELASQLTLFESELFSAIAPRELLDSSWSKPNAHLSSPNILNLIAQHTLLQDWVISSLLRLKSLRDRVRQMTFFFTLGVELFRLSNFSSLAAIDTGLSLPAVKRLKFTFADVNPALQAEWKQISSSISSVNNYGALRPILKAARAPIVPPLGMFLTDLIHIEDRNQLYTSRGLVNWKKLELVSAVIQQIQDFQVPYLAIRDPRFYPALVGTKSAKLSSEQQFAISSEREPRNSKKADLVP